MSLPKTYEGFEAEYEKELTWEFVNDKLLYDPDTGVMTWRKSERCIVAGSRAGGVCPDGRYRTIKINRRVVLEHKLIWFLVTKTWPKPTLDHKNRIGTDNRIENLRVASWIQNAANKPRKGPNPGARCINGKYFFRIRLPDRTRFESKPFATMEEAAAAYKAMAREVHGEFYCED